MDGFVVVSKDSLCLFYYSDFRRSRNSLSLRLIKPGNFKINKKPRWNSHIQFAHTTAFQQLNYSELLIELRTNAYARILAKSKLFFFSFAK